MPVLDRRGDHPLSFFSITTKHSQHNGLVVKRVRDGLSDSQIVEGWTSQVECHVEDAKIPNIGNTQI